MAGKNQHYIPRFLQRGFLHDPQEKAERTWLHRRGAQPRLVGIRSVGASEYFYSKLSADGSETLDDQITALEGGLAAEVAALRNKPIGVPVDAHIAARLTTHLLLRTAHLRSVFSQGAVQLMDGAASAFADTAAMRHVFKVDSLEESTAFSQELETAVQKLPLEALSIPRPLASRIAMFFARERFDSVYNENRSTIATALAHIVRMTPDMARDAHNKSLTSLKGGAWESFLQALEWRVQAVSGAVLPDCVVIAREIGHEFTPFLLSERDDVELVIVPLAHDRLLLGARDPHCIPTLETLNAASAACCDNFFISRSEAEGAELSHLIGQRSTKFIEASVADALSTFRPHSETQADRAPIERNLTGHSTTNNFSYSLTCVGFEGTDAAAALGEIVHAVVLELSRNMPLRSLDGIVFADDYAAAVRNVDRGDPSLGTDSTQSREYGRAVAKPVKVIRSGAPKTQLVMDASIAAGLLSGDHAHQQGALHILVKALASIAHSDLYESKLPTLTPTPPNEAIRFLYPWISTAPGNYFSARESAFIDPTAGERLATLVIDSLTSARQSIENSRLQYRLDNDLGSLLTKALPPISFVLGHAAEWLGHKDGLPDQDQFPGAMLLAKLQDFELHHWLELFGRDLRTLYAADEQFTTERVFALSGHVERLLWTVQLFPWPMDDGSLFVSVPWGEDEARRAEMKATSQQSNGPSPGD
jgi:hypothetical protein